MSFRQRGGLKVGAKTDAWNRKIVRLFDTATGKINREEIFRYEDSDDPTIRWVKIQL